MKQTLKAKLQAKGPEDAWVHLPIPFDVTAVFGSKARVPVIGTINGFAFRNSLMPEGGSPHYMMINKDIRAGAKVGAGDYGDRHNGDRQGGEARHKAGGFHKSSFEKQKGCFAICRAELPATEGIRRLDFGCEAG